MDAAGRQHCLSALRALDRDRYLACLLAPEAKRDALVSLALFNAEIARIREIVKEPMAGEIRMQWWRDVITGTSPGGPGGNPAAEALVETIAAHHLPVATFEAYLDARTFDLYDDPMPDRATLEGYAGETASALIQLSAMTLDASAARAASDAAGHGGVAQTIAGILLLLPQHTARGQLYMPADILSACGLTRQRFLVGDDLEAVRAAIIALAALGCEHLEKARAAARNVAPSVFPAFLPVALVDQVLARAQKSVDPRRDVPSSPQWRRQSRLFRAALAGRF